MPPSMLPSGSAAAAHNAASVPFQVEHPTPSRASHSKSSVPLQVERLDKKILLVSAGSNLSCAPRINVLKRRAACCAAAAPLRLKACTRACPTRIRMLGDRHEMLLPSPRLS
eukprot:scaffold162_cov275-Pinguiococcus_pyrenoidosus.AAC.8